MKTIITNLGFGEFEDVMSLGEGRVFTVAREVGFQVARGGRVGGV